MVPVDTPIVERALGAVAGRSLAVILFGSHARGGATADSDVDVLQIVPTATLPYRLGVVTISPYTSKQFVSMAEQGSLFVLHILREGVVLRDDIGFLDTVRRAFRMPASYEFLRREVSAAARLLDTDEAGYADKWQRLHALVAHLVRSYAYAVLADRGELVFGMREVAARLNDPRLLTIPGLPRRVGPCLHAFRDAVAVLAHYLGTTPANPYGSVEALIVNAYGRSVLTVILGLRLLNESGEPLTYETLDAAGSSQCNGSLR